MKRFALVAIGLCLAIRLCPAGYAQETLTVTSGQGTIIKVGLNTLVEMQTDEKGVETYILSPAASSKLAGVTIIDPGDPQKGIEPTETNAFGKKITICLPPRQNESRGTIDFLIENEARIEQGSNRMYGPVSIQFKEQVLIIRGSAEREGTGDGLTGAGVLVVADEDGEERDSNRMTAIPITRAVSKMTAIPVNKRLCNMARLLRPSARLR